MTGKQAAAKVGETWVAKIASGPRAIVRITHITAGSRRAETWHGIRLSTGREVNVKPRGFVRAATEEEIARAREGLSKPGFHRNGHEA